MSCRVNLVTSSNHHIVTLYFILTHLVPSTHTHTTVRGGPMRLLLRLRTRTASKNANLFIWRAAPAGYPADITSAGGVTCFA